VIVKDVQRHPAKTAILHLDFLRISKTTALTIRVPLHFINEDSCIGVKKEGGIISHTMSELEVQCLPKDLPEYIEVDVSELALGSTLHISDITLPKGVESVALSHGSDHDLPVAAVNKAKSGGSEAEANGDAEGDSDGEADES
jgi:large subunit ribosomal protein L25